MLICIATAQLVTYSTIQSCHIYTKHEYLLWQAFSCSVEASLCFVKCAYSWGKSDRRLDSSNEARLQVCNSPEEGDRYRISHTIWTCSLLHLFYLLYAISIWEFTSYVYPYSSGLLHWKWCNPMTAPVPGKKPKRIWEIATINKPQHQCNNHEICASFLFEIAIINISVGWCKKDVTPLLMHWSYIFLALTHR